MTSDTRQTPDVAAMALVYAHKGWRVAPLHEATGGRCTCGKPCETPAKHPRTLNGITDASSDPEQVAAWWREWPTANVAVATGNGLYVLDIDGETGRHALEALEAEHEPLPDTLTVRTGRDGGGEHRYFTVPAGLELPNCSGKTIAAGIDGRGTGGYVCAPPSVHASGRPYKWSRVGAPAELPAWVIAKLSHRNGATAQAPPKPPPDVDDGERRRMEAWTRALLTERVETLRALPRETGNGRGDKFYGAAISLGECVGAGVLDHAEATGELRACAAYLGLPDAHHAWRSIDRGLQEGAAKPLTVAEMDRRAPRPANARRAGRKADTTSEAYRVTFTDEKTPKLILPDVPAGHDTAALAAWITGVLRLDPQHPCTTATRYGRRGQAGAVKINRADAEPIQFEPAALIDTARRFIPALGWQLLPTDGEPYGFKDEHCRRIGHVLRLLSGIYETATEADRTYGIVGTFVLGAEAIEGHTTYGTTAQRYEAARVLRRDLDAMSGRPIGPPRYLVDSDTGELVIRVSDLQAAARSHLGTTLADGWLDGRMDDIGWDRRRLSGHAIPGRVGRNGPHARIDVYRGHSPNTDDDGTADS